MKLIFCGGADEIGASCILLEIAGKRILLDCGMRMKGDSLPDLQTIKQHGELDAIILSHAHMDHSGSLPVICSEFSSAKIYMTAPSQALIKVLLFDSIKIMNNDGEIPKFSKKHVEHLLENIIPVSFNDQLSLFDDNDLQITFYPAGHILGASSIYFESNEGTLFYSGDISSSDQRTINGLSIPKLRPDICILESTYGNRLHSNRKIEETKLIEMVAQTLKSEGRVLIPAFAVGRAQEVILTLRSAINRGQLPDIKIYIDGMVKNVCRIYAGFPNYLRETLAKRIWQNRDVFFCDNVIAVETKEQREKLLNDTSPYCVISSSGMLSGGPSTLYAERFSEDSNAFIGITGYQDEESPGRKLQELFTNSEKEKIWKINNKNVHFKCGLGTYSLSAHSDKSELLNLIEHLNPKEVFLVHGDHNAINALGRDMQLKSKCYVYAPVNGSDYHFEKKYGKRRIRKLPGSLKNSRLPNDNDMQGLSEYLLSKKDQPPWTAIELLRIWGIINTISPEIETQTIAMLSKSEWFEYDRKRLFLFYPIVPDKQSELQIPERMEMNQMLALIVEIFPPDSGLYKKGYRIEEGIALLSFRFPVVAKKKYKNEFIQFETDTGWKVELNKQPDTSFIKILLENLMENNKNLIGKTAYHLDKNQIVVSLSHTINNADKIIEDFNLKTGMELLLTVQGNNVITTKNSNNNSYPGGEPVNCPKPYNRDDAVEMVRSIFEPSEVKIYKYSIKSDPIGSYIELQFLSSEIGKRFQKWINDLKEVTGWRIVYSMNPRQQELIDIAKHIFLDKSIPILKGPSIHSQQCKVIVKIAVPEEENSLESLKAEFIKTTGYKLEIQHM